MQMQTASPSDVPIEAGGHATSSTGGNSSAAAASSGAPRALALVSCIVLWIASLVVASGPSEMLEVDASAASAGSVDCVTIRANELPLLSRSAFDAGGPGMRQLAPASSLSSHPPSHSLSHTASRSITCSPPATVLYPTQRPTKVPGAPSSVALVLFGAVMDSRGYVANVSSGGSADQAMGAGGGRCSLASGLRSTLLFKETQELDLDVKSTAELEQSVAAAIVGISRLRPRDGSDTVSSGSSMSLSVTCNDYDTGGAVFACSSDGSSPCAKRSSVPFVNGECFAGPELSGLDSRLERLPPSVSVQVYCGDPPAGLTRVSTTVVTARNHAQQFTRYV